MITYLRQITYNEDAVRAVLLAQDSFNLFIEPLAQLIRQEIALEGVTISGTKHKVCLYADDVLVALKKPPTSLPLLMDLQSTYGK